MISPHPCLPHCCTDLQRRADGADLRRRFAAPVRFRIVARDAMSSGWGSGRVGMTMTTRVLSVSVPVTDQDAALAFYTEVLGYELRTDIEVWAGARMVEVAPPGSGVSLVLLPPDSQIPVAIRLGTTDAERAHAAMREAGGTLH